jgi:hypothetical protein
VVPVFEYGEGVERVYWSWNGRWGRLARQDVKVYKDGSLFTVEHLQGGTEGRRRTWEELDREEAWDTVKGLLSESDGWREMK